MYINTQKNEKELLSMLREGSEEAFDHFFRVYYRDLVLFAGKFLKSQEASEDVVQSVFLQLWDNRGTLQIDNSLKSFLLKSVQNHCLNLIRHENSVRAYDKYIELQSEFTPDYSGHYNLYSEFQEHLTVALAKLPEKQRESFELSRFEGLKYAEIATRLGVSQRTVEVRIGEALKQLKIYLSDFLILIISVFFIK